MVQLKICRREFPGGLVVRILGFHCHGLGSIPSQRTEILQAMRRGQKKKRKICKKVDLEHFLLSSDKAPYNNDDDGFIYLAPVEADTMQRHYLSFISVLQCRGVAKSLSPFTNEYTERQKGKITFPWTHS